MATWWCKVLTLISCLLTISISRGNDCAEAKHDLMRCMMNSQLDYSRLSDLSYQHELCIETQTLFDCRDEARDECPIMALLSGDVGKSLDAMATAVKAYCPEEPIENCKYPASDIVACTQSLLVASDNICLLIDQYVICLRRIQARCKDHPILETVPIEFYIATIQGMTASIC